MRLSSRLDRLERTDGVVLPPAVKAWLGQPLSEVELATLDNEAGMDPDFDEIDMAKLSAEMREWLSMD